MPNEYGNLNITEAAAYLGVSGSVLTSLIDAGGGPPHYPEKAEQSQFAYGPWFPKWGLEQYRSILWVEVANLEHEATITSSAGEPKSTQAKHLPPGASIFST